MNERDDEESAKTFNRDVQRLRKVRSKALLLQTEQDFRVLKARYHDRRVAATTQPDIAAINFLYRFLCSAGESLIELTPSTASTDAGYFALRRLADAVACATLSTEASPAGPSAIDYLMDAYRALGGCEAALNIGGWVQGSRRAAGQTGWNSDWGARLEADLTAGTATGSVAQLAKSRTLSERHVKRIRGRVKDKGQRTEVIRAGLW